MRKTIAAAAAAIALLGACAPQAAHAEQHRVRGEGRHPTSGLAPCAGYSGPVEEPATFVSYGEDLAVAPGPDGGLALAGPRATGIHWCTVGLSARKRWLRAAVIRWDDQAEGRAFVQKSRTGFRVLVCGRDTYVNASWLAGGPTESMSEYEVLNWDKWAKRRDRRSAACSSYAG